MVIRKLGQSLGRGDAEKFCCKADRRDEFYGMSSSMLCVILGFC